ncbi:1,4-dihydroxy-2-naphthoate polyprenyltransferase [Enterococcus sp. JM9B]|uniref:1,4-dihydroxy-2-naphthoate polyprenyltransferase n=1 Tax=Enterococcus sp. JM9B TaxID=1857216 RepID=UPI0013750E66|nr:1,4-dihydroxy-2-naphthoate polyprenyltransferase [Enterococcus sp. JM9B]KAF1301552.1 1,4-dihydroxy-2-naphthoate polyprenyltransferase [Enterococcus sp. JM9B]
MSLKVFLEVVEIKTKIASVFPFLMGVLFSISYFHGFHFLNTLLFFIGMLIFDLTTTAINNYMDFEKAKSEEYKYQQNVIGRENVAPKLVQRMILGMLVFVLLIGIILTIRTGWLLLVMGFVCCFIGVFYTFGPIPLSRMPLGEVFSGVTMGLGIFAMVVYVNTVSPQVFYLDLQLKAGTFALTGNFWQVAALVWASLPLIFTIANIMLANNLRDLETDIKNHRYTLVYYIGREHGIKLFSLLMLSCYAVLIVGVFLRVFEWPVLIALGTFPKVRQHLRAHRKELPQPHSFVYSLKNMVLFNSAYAIGLLLTILWQQLS